MTAPTSAGLHEAIGELRGDVRGIMREIQALRDDGRQRDDTVLATLRERLDHEGAARVAVENRVVSLSSRVGCVEQAQQAEVAARAVSGRWRAATVSVLGIFSGVIGAIASRYLGVH